MPNRFRPQIAIALLLLSLAACSKKSAPKNEKHYDLDGKVVSVDKAAKEITIDHKDIPGFMKAMTMPYKIGPDDLWALDRAQPGDRISATIIVTDDDGYLASISLTNAASANADSAGGTVSEPKAGVEIPDFTFTNQDGKQVRLSQLRGGPVLLTFIYTRCPLPDFCIRMSSNFAHTAKLLQVDSPKTWQRIHMLSISFDPEFDKPSVLRQYGHAYAAAVDPDFKQWQFVTSSPDEVHKSAEFFGLVYDKQKEQIIHSLRTAVIDKDGKLVSLYHGNEWKPEDIAKQLEGLK